MSVGTCVRCGRKLTNPHSIARSLGPVCYAKSGGGVFDADLQVDEKEWARRSVDLKAVYREAVAAGPTYSAMAYRARREAGRKARIEWRKNQRRLMKGLMVI